MTLLHASLAHAFADYVRLPVDQVEDGCARSVTLEGGLALEFIWVAEVPALCLAMAVGQILRASQDECLAGALASNLYLADVGAPHYALSPQQDTLYLCQTLSGDPFDASQVGPAVDRLAELARQARAGLLERQAIA